MILENINHDCGYHTQKIVTMFFPLEKIRNDEPSEIVVKTALNNQIISVDVKLYAKAKRVQHTLGKGEDVAQAMSLLLFEVLAELTGFRPPWGILYGVRPARLMHAKTDLLGEQGARDYFSSCLVQPQKIDLTTEVMHRENKIIALSKPNSCSLYVSIPFCPSRCSYCSFVSHSIENAAGLMEQYVKLLCQELTVNAKIVQDLNLKIETIYFGGGTPTTLSEQQLDRILAVIEQHYDLSTLREYTVEAGRPDTVTAAKLNTLLRHGVGRISINPQTFNDDVRAAVGRRHTTEQTLQAYALAKQCGFENINMDLIAGLNGESLASFQNSVNTAVSLGAASVTVHNLALKSGAYLVTENEYYDLSKKATAAAMVDYSYEKLGGSGYHPYYMYRQSKSLGNLENVGWSKEGFECLYNVFMMDETHTVIAAGAGAVTKLKHSHTGHIERIYNFKYPYEYIKDFDKLLAKKQGIYSFYQA